MYAQITNNISEKLTKMIPTWFQNVSKLNPGGALGATWEPPLKQGASKTSCLTILVPFWDPFGTSLVSFWASCFDVFLKWLFDGLGLHLGSQNTSKMRPKRGAKRKAEIHRFCLYLSHVGHIQGCNKSVFFDVFL